MDDSVVAAVRLDVWLDVACLFRTRSEAQKACKSGKIDVNGQPAKPNRLLRVGDELVIGRPYGRKQRVAVRGLADRHVAKPQARQLYEEMVLKKPAAALVQIGGPLGQGNGNDKGNGHVEPVTEAEKVSV